MIRALSTSRIGKEWLEWMGRECTQTLEYIESNLMRAWNSGQCYPSAACAMLPFITLPRSKTRVVLICKEPYRSPTMACGIPVLSADGRQTPSSEIFKSLIGVYWDGVTQLNYMSLYYRSGILVLNSSFTIAPIEDDRYGLTESHFPLWTNFMVPFVRKLSEDGVPIVALGAESRGLIRGLVQGPKLIRCTFPSDNKSITEFMNVMTYVISEYVFEVTP